MAWTFPVRSELLFNVVIDRSLIVIFIASYNRSAAAGGA